MRSLPLIVLAILTACGQSSSRPGTTATPAVPLPALTVVTYNIRHGRGMDEQVNLERTAAALRRLDPDLVGLQEVDNRASRSGSVDQAAELGRLLGMHHAFGAFMSLQGGQYGMAILSRRPIVAATPVELPTGNEPRVALAVELAFPDGTRLMVVNVHFDWVENDSFRFAQAQELTVWLDALPIPYLIMGDFNDVPESRTLKLWADRAVPAAKPTDQRFTFSSTRPAREIDHLFLSPQAPWQIGAATVIDDPVTSDHRAVMTRLTPRRP